VHLLAVLQGQADDVLQCPSRSGKKDIIGALEGHYGDHQLAAAYRSQPKARIQLSGELLQELSAAVKQLAHQALVGLPVDSIQREAAHAFVDGVRDRELKQHLLMGGDRLLNQALKLDAAKGAAGPPAKLQEVTRTPLGLHAAATSQVPQEWATGLLEM
jgi:hypothetical protein